MHSKIKYGLVTLLFSCSTFCIGIYYGFHSGSQNYYALESVLSANIDMLRAKDLDSGTEKDLKAIYWHFNMNIDRAIDSYVWYQDDGDRFLSELFLADHLRLLPASIERLAKYRKQNPTKDFGREICNLQAESEEDKTYCNSHYDKREQTIGLLGSE